MLRTGGLGRHPTVVFGMPGGRALASTGATSARAIHPGAIR